MHNLYESELNTKNDQSHKIQSPTTIYILSDRTIQAHRQETRKYAIKYLHLSLQNRLISRNRNWRARDRRVSVSELFVHDEESSLSRAFVSLMIALYRLNALLLSTSVHET